MYQVARFFSIVVVFATAYVGLLLTIQQWPQGVAIPILAGLIYIVSRKRQQLTALGSARFANADDLEKAGMLSASSGLLLGRLEVPRSKNVRFASLFDCRVSARHACRQLWVGTHRNEVVRLPQAIHSAVFGPTGTGKGQSFIIPWLKTCPDNAVIIDFKGENAKLTAEFRRKKFGHEIVLLDPSKVVSQTPSCYNPIDWISKGDLALDECNDLAKALILRNPNEPERHWNDWAEAWTAAVVAVVVHYGKDDMRSVQTVREFLSDPRRLEMAVQLMRESGAWSGMLARWGNQLSYLVDKEKLSTLSTVSRQMRFLDTISVAESTRTSTFDPTKLRNGKMTIYLILPPEHMRAQSSLLRMWITSFLRVVVAGGLQEEHKVHFVLDETASLGHLECIDDALDKYRAYGVRCQFYFQSLGQSKICFPEGQDVTFLSNTSHTFMSVNDNASAEEVSKRIGETTIVVNSGGTNSGGSSQRSHGGQTNGSTSSSYGANSSWSQVARRVLKPEEVMALPQRTAITFVPSCPPLKTTLLRDYEEPHLYRKLRRVGSAFATLLLSGLFAAMMLFAAVGMTSDLTSDPEAESRTRQRQENERMQDAVARGAAQRVLEDLRRNHNR